MSDNLDVDGLKIALCQMKVIPGQPDLNVAYIKEEIKRAIERRVDIIIFPELAVTGYFIGDLFEQADFLADVRDLNEEIRQATRGGIVAIIGTTVSSIDKIGFDGWQRLSNAAVIYSNGRYLGHTTKSLQPNYRMFDDNRHFFSNGQIALENCQTLRERLQPIIVDLKDGRSIALGVMLCEDMWYESYPINPGRILVEQGAEILINLSASPWTWQKNRKRHQIVEGLARNCAVPFVYVNNTGLQNTGKNLIVFDGNSTIYNRAGKPIFEVPAYESGSYDFVLQADATELSNVPQDDDRELYLALKTGVQEFFMSQPPEQRKIIIGLSGGIDSALAAALYTDALGKENVIGINMPSKFSSELHQELAWELAQNLGIAYAVIPIQDLVDRLSAVTDVQEGTLAYENIQARVRMEILAARAQKEQCLFSANWNKVEAAFGYGTLYADMAGALAIEGDLIKREIYQIADYLNRQVFGRIVIPERCFTVKPTAELRSTQSDPFDYGNLARRGYHDEMVRAFVEFRKSPEWFLELFLSNALEQTLGLESGLLKQLFPSARLFIYDLEKHWRMFHSAYFKRIQGPPILIVSRRAFGTDLRESLVAPHFTNRYFELRAKILNQEPLRIAVYGTAANPPCRHHYLIVQELLGWFDQVIIVPSGNRADKTALQLTAKANRKEMVKRNFAGLSRITIDFSDLDEEIYTPTYYLNERLSAQYPDYEIWFIVGADLIAGGSTGQSKIQTSWVNGREVWQQVRFTIMARGGIEFTEQDLPPRAELLPINNWPGSSTQVRQKIVQGEDVSLYLMPTVLEYIVENQLYINEGGGK